MSAKLTPEQLNEIRSILKRDPPTSITDEDFDSALEEISAANPQLAAEWVITFDESEAEAPKVKLPAEVTARRARRTAFVSSAARTATSAPLAEEDSPVRFQVDQRRIALLVGGLVLLVVLGIVVYWVADTRSSSLVGPVVEPVVETPVTDLPVIPAPPPPVVVEPPPAPVERAEPAPAPAREVFTNQTPAPAPSPAPTPARADSELQAPLTLEVSMYNESLPGDSVNAVLYREAPPQGVSSGLNPVFVHVSDAGAGGPINISGVSQAGQGVASGLASNATSSTGATAGLLLYNDEPAAGPASDAIVFTDSGSMNSNSDSITYADSVPSTTALEVYNNGESNVNEAVMQPGGLMRETFPLNSLAGDASFESPADALRAAGIPDSANAALGSGRTLADEAGEQAHAAPSFEGSLSSQESHSAGSVGSQFSSPLPTSQAEFDAFTGDFPLASDPVGGVGAPSVSTDFASGERVPARLVTSATILDGIPAPVIAETFGMWCSVEPCPQVTFIGEASLLGPDRVVINFHTMVTDGVATGFTGIALSEDYGTSIPATIRDETPALAPNLVRASLGGVSAYAQAMLNQSQTTFLPDGGTIQQSVMPSLEALIAGNMASALQLPQSTQTVVRVAELDPGVDIIVAVGLSY